MKKVLIFGAGSAGKLALDALASDRMLEVAGFCDNDTSKHGTPLFGQTVFAPDALASLDFDLVVIASRYFQAIIPQLLQLGVHLDRISVFIPEEGLRPAIDFTRQGDIDGECGNVASQFPVILIVTEDVIELSHGTGSALLRLFQYYPKANLINVFLYDRGNAVLPRSYRVDATMTSLSVASRLQSRGIKVDLIYGCCYGVEGLKILIELARVLPDTPVIQHFQDLIRFDEGTFPDVLAAASPLVDDFWAIESGLAAEIGKHVGRNVKVMNPVKGDLPLTFKKSHREYPPDFRAVVLGNSHVPHVMGLLADVWRSLRNTTPKLPAIQWMAHPDSVARVRQAGIDFEPEVQYVGKLLDPDTLHQRLCEADLALVPFEGSKKANHEISYASYSIPSRLFEIMSAGLPSLITASDDTAVHRLMNESKAGWTAPCDDMEKFKDILVGIMGDTNCRATAGMNARNFAEQNFDVNLYRQQFFDHMDLLVRARKFGAFREC